jgi:hypothetical protein
VQTREQTAARATTTVVTTATGHSDRSKSRCYKRNGRQNNHSQLTHRKSS